MVRAVSKHDAATGFRPFLKSEIEQSIPARFEQQVRRFPDRAAVWTKHQALSYRTLDRTANRVGNAIRERSLSPGEPVALLFDQGVPSTIAILGALKAGGVYVPLDGTAPHKQLEAQLGDADASLILHDASHAALARSLSARSRRTLHIGELGGRISDKRPEVQLGPDSLAYIFYTSGSTGRPKGVVDNHRNVLHNVLRYTNSLKISAGDKLTLVQHPAFSGSVSSLFCALLNGATTFPLDLRQHGLKALAALIVDQELTVYHSVPAIFQELLSIHASFKTLRVIRLEGDQVLPRHVDSFKHHFCPPCVLVNGLGATETGITRQFFLSPDTDLTGHTVPIGFPTEDMDTYIVDEAGSEVPAGQIGEIVIGSRYLALGYWRQPDRTRSALETRSRDDRYRTYRTGDLGRLHADGCLDFLGRSDFHVKLRGRWVDVAAVEDALNNLPNVAEAAVRPHENALGERRLIGYVVPTNGYLSVSQIRRNLAESTPAELIPARFVFLDALPLDPNGKIARSALPAPQDDRPALDTPFVPPRGRTETALARLFEQVLGVADIGIEDDFFDLGGDSLRALRLLGLIEAKFGITIPNSVLLQARTVAALSQLVESRPTFGNLVLLRRGSRTPPVFLVHAHLGQVLHFSRLAHWLGNDRSIYGVQAETPGGTRVGAATVESMARQYLAAIREVQPHGPFLLGGHCFGARVALEMAQQLTAQGERTALLILLDPDPPRGVPNPLAYASAAHRQRIQRHLEQLRTGNMVTRLRYLGARSSRAIAHTAAWCRRRLTAAGIEIALKTGIPRRWLPFLLRTAFAETVHQRAARSYHVRTYGGQVVLVGLRDGDATLKDYDAWRHYLPGALEMHMVSAPPWRMLQEPHVREVARQIRPILHSAAHDSS